MDVDRHLLVKPNLRVAYLVGRYPAISHTFILREVRGLRARGMEIDTISIHRVGEDQLLTEADRDEFAGTYTILPPRWTELVRAHALALIRGPRRYLATLALAMRLSGPGLRARIWQLFYFAEAMIVWRRCRERGITHLHAHHMSQVTDVALLITAYERGTNPRWSWSFTVHGSDEFYEVSRFKLAPKVEHADFVVCISDYTRSQLMRLVGEEHWAKLSVVRCGIDTDSFTRPGDRGQDNPFRILWIGRLVPVKGLPLLIESVTRLAEKGVDVGATLVGTGPALEPLQELAVRRGVSDRVVFTGAIGQDAIPNFYADADVFCLPSFAEGVPVVLMEAMAAELPVVASRITGIPELVDDKVAGLLVPPGNLDELTGALERLSRNPRMRLSLGRAGRRKVEADYSLAPSVEKLESLFNQHVRVYETRSGHRDRSC